MNEENENLVLDFFAAFSRLDVEVMVGFFAEDGIYEDPPNAGTVAGHDAMRKLFQLWTPASPIYSVELVSIASKGNLVLSERIDHFRLADRHLAVPMAAAIKITDGKITHMREYWDKGTSGLVEAGLIP